MALQLFAVVKIYLNLFILSACAYSLTNADLIFGSHAFFSSLLSSLFYLRKLLVS